MAGLEQEALDVIRRVFLTELEHPGMVESAHDLQRDLHVDSLNAVVLAVALEDHFQVRLASEDTVGVVTVGDLTARVAERVRASRAEGVK